jgi:hypothetical protein
VLKFNDLPYDTVAHIKRNAILKITSYYHLKPPIVILSVNSFAHYYITFFCLFQDPWRIFSKKFTFF